MAFTSTWARHIFLAFTFSILLLKWASTDRLLPFDVATFPKPTGILTECTWNVRVSKDCIWHLIASPQTLCTGRHARSDPSSRNSARSERSGRVLLIGSVVDRYALHITGIRFAQTLFKQLVHPVSEISRNVLHRCARERRSSHP